MAKHHCDECSKNDENCCTTFYSKFVTIGDARRISGRISKKPSSFIKFSELTEWDRKTELFMSKSHSYYYDLALGGKILQLKTKKDGSCVFYSKGSCSIYPSRPLICRVFPFWFEGNAKIIADNNGFDCTLICGKKPLVKNPSICKIRTGLKRMECKESEMGKLLCQLRIEIEEYKAGIESFVRKNSL